MRQPMSILLAALLIDAAMLAGPALARPWLQPLALEAGQAEWVLKRLVGGVINDPPPPPESPPNSWLFIDSLRVQCAARECTVSFNASVLNRGKTALVGHFGFIYGPRIGWVKPGEMMSVARAGTLTSGWLCTTVSDEFHCTRDKSSLLPGDSLSVPFRFSFIVPEGVSASFVHHVLQFNCVRHGTLTINHKLKLATPLDPPIVAASAEDVAEPAPADPAPEEGPVIGAPAEEPVEEPVEAPAESTGLCQPGTTAKIAIPGPLNFLNLRRSAGGAVLNKLREGLKVSVAGECASRSGGTWCQIDKPMKGCVSAKFLVFDGAAGSEPAAGFR